MNLLVHFSDDSLSVLAQLLQSALIRILTINNSSAPSSSIWCNATWPYISPNF
jgi:hypothetical protein